MEEEYIALLTEGYHNKCLVLGIGQPVVEHSGTLVPPQSHKIASLLKAVSNRESEPMVDTRKISQVENVVEF